MRLIGKLDNEKDARFFSSFLNQKEVPNQVEVIINNDWGSDYYGTAECLIWVNNEERVDEALDWFKLFKANPFDPFFSDKKMIDALNANRIAPVSTAPLPSSADPDQLNTAPPNPSLMGQTMGVVTRILLLGCCLLFFIAQFLAPSKKEEVPSIIYLFSSPIEKTLLFDYPHVYELIDRMIQLYGYEALQDASHLPAEQQQLIKQINDTPYWQGLYTIVLKNGFGHVLESIKSTPMFEKIQQGQIWRFISPCFLHADLFHLFFNMLWLIVLGKQIEFHLGKARYIFFIVITGVISNTAQYLMGGANFIGFSGILCAMLAFIWMRQRVSPWEGYQLDRSTVIFMLIFIVAMALIQSFSFVLEKSIDVTISPGIANMAHLSGACIGLILGRLNFFRWRIT